MANVFLFLFVPFGVSSQEKWQCDRMVKSLYLGDRQTEDLILMCESGLTSLGLSFLLCQWDSDITIKLP